MVLDCIGLNPVFRISSKRTEPGSEKNHSFELQTLAGEGPRTAQIIGTHRLTGPRNPLKGGRPPAANEDHFALALEQAGL